MNLYSLRPFPLRSPTRNAGFTLLELLVTVAIVGVLAALLTPVVGSMQKKAAATQCVSNLRQVFSFLMEDTQQAGDLPPAWNGSTGWVNDKYNALKAEGNPGYKAFGCPLQRKSMRMANDARTYSMNSHLVNAGWNNPPPGRVSRFRDHSKIAVLTDGAIRDGAYNVSASIPFPPQLIHDGKANIAFLDGHVEPVKDIPNNQSPQPGTPESIFWLGR